MMGKLTAGLKKTRTALSGRLREVFAPGAAHDEEETLEALEEALLLSDVGLGTIEKLLARLSKDARGGTSLVDALKGRMTALWPENPAPEGPPPAPWVHLFIGVNGVGKTTTIGKLAAKRTAAGQSGLLGAADTFRAAAAEQLEIWAERAGTAFLRQREGADPAAVAFDSVQVGMSKRLDFVFVDTAGRLHVKHNLMAELEKIYRVIGKAMEGAPHQVSLVLDATTGQNGLSQARRFLEAVPVSDLVLTKLDGTAKGGIALSIADELQLPIRMVGVGESVEDLIPFDPGEYVDALLSLENDA